MGYVQSVRHPLSKSLPVADLSFCALAMLPRLRTQARDQAKLLLERKDQTFQEIIDVLQGSYLYFSPHLHPTHPR